MAEYSIENRTHQQLMVVRNQKEMDSVPFDYDGEILVVGETFDTVIKVHEYVNHPMVTVYRSKVIATGTADITAMQQSEITVRDHANAAVLDNSKAIAEDNANLFACDESVITLKDNSTATIENTVTAICFDNSKVISWDDME